MKTVICSNQLDNVNTNKVKISCLLIFAFQKLHFYSEYEAKILWDGMTPLDLYCNSINLSSLFVDLALKSPKQ